MAASGCTRLALVSHFSKLTSSSMFPCSSTVCVRCHYTLYTLMRKLPLTPLNNTTSGRERGYHIVGGFAPYSQVHTDASGLPIAQAGTLFLVLLTTTLSIATVSYHVVISPNMRSPESRDRTCMNSHRLGADHGFILFCGSFSQFAVSNSSILKCAILCVKCILENLCASLIPALYPHSLHSSSTRLTPLLKLAISPANRPIEKLI
jgi:hypothetical protein